jgi:hypothetical protein
MSFPLGCGKPYRKRTCFGHHFFAFVAGLCVSTVILAVCFGQIVVFTIKKQSFLEDNRIYSLRTKEKYRVVDNNLIPKS